MEIIIGLLLLLLILILLYPFAQGAAFVPSSPAKVEIMIKLAEVKPGELAADLGSGDGRIVIALAQAGAIAHGYEINPLLVWWSRRKIRRAGLESKAFIHWRNFWREDLSAFGVIVVFGIGYIMPRLAKKLKKELYPGAKIISSAFPFPGLQYVQKQHAVFVYQIL